ncbi:hypothetical protein SmJEL517_g04749 [Synchytrium microbalum]|uniref:Uncharacterized protein n=1 Tax=Synchytrium microbalum TaxID=1806994 RepID=A0A507C3E0_9FUNG|nr:uncharacterized protein SmJEL517_g04749 [Synchytrium microbalum]TPX32033.1 hypothetical protein SmJEL517_g04749 [Synchytrium microbalum]
MAAMLHFSDADYCYGNRTTCGQGGPSKELTVIDLQNFCLFLPPVKTEIVMTSEGCCETCADRKATNCEPIASDAVSFCTFAGLTAGSRVFPSGFFTSAHLVRDTLNKKIQITGTYKPSVWGVSNDDGGQYDLTGTNQYRVNSPPGGKPVGYLEYLSLVGSGVFCIQMCSTPYGCNSDNDYQGCEVAIPGNYNAGYTQADGVILRQNSPPPTNIEGLPKTLVGPPKITAGPSTVASPGAAQPANTGVAKKLSVYGV